MKQTHAQTPAVERTKQSPTIDTSEPTFYVDTILIDIDTTLVDPRPGKTPGIFHDETLARMLMEKDTIPFESAMACIYTAITEADRTQTPFWPFDAFQRFQIDESDFQKQLLRVANDLFYMHPDASRFLRAIRALPGLRIFPATTNPAQAIRAKLSVDLALPPDGIFNELFGGDEVCAGGKNSPHFYQQILQRIGAQPETTLMIGDDPCMDLSFAQGAGITQVILPRRAQNAAWIREPDGGIYVQSLETVLAWISISSK